MKEGGHRDSIDDTILRFVKDDDFSIKLFRDTSFATVFSSVVKGQFFRDNPSRHSFLTMASFMRLALPLQGRKFP